jgi:hypothetical protein
MSRNWIRPTASQTRVVYSSGRSAWYRPYPALLLCIASVIPIACVHTSDSTPLRIDGSTPEAFRSSWDRLHKSLTAQQQSQLDVAILPIALGKYRSLLDVPPSLMAGIGPQNIRTEIDGMSFAEILDLARKQPIKVEIPRHP